MNELINVGDQVRLVRSTPVLDVSCVGMVGEVLEVGGAAFNRVTSMLVEWHGAENNFRSLVTPSSVERFDALD